MFFYGFFIFLHFLAFISDMKRTGLIWGEMDSEHLGESSIQFFPYLHTSISIQQFLSALVEHLHEKYNIYIYI